MPEHPGQEVWLPTGAHGIHYVANPENKTLLYCHGNAGNISYWKDNIELILASGINVFIFDYRGFGKAKGFPLVQDMIADGMAAYDHLVKHVPPEKIVLWGESLGGHVALNVARKKKISCLVIAASFTSAADMVEAFELNWLYKQAAKMEPMDNLRLIKFCHVPTVVMHSPDDDVIPFSCGRRLFEASPTNVKLFIEISGSHAAPLLNKENLKWLLDFCDIPTDCSDVDPLLQKICRNAQKNCPFTLPANRNRLDPGPKP